MATLDKVSVAKGTVVVNGNAFSEAARAAGIRKSAHGVRKLATTRAADNGATVHQMMTIFRAVDTSSGADGFG